MGEPLRKAALLPCINAILDNPPSPNRLDVGTPMPYLAKVRSRCIASCQCLGNYAKRRLILFNFSWSRPSPVDLPCHTTSVDLHNLQNHNHDVSVPA